MVWRAALLARNHFCKNLNIVAVRFGAPGAAVQLSQLHVMLMTEPDARPCFKRFTHAKQHVPPAWLKCQAKLALPLPSGSAELQCGFVENAEGLNRCSAVAVLASAARSVSQAARWGDVFEPRARGG